MNRDSSSSAHLDPSRLQGARANKRLGFESGPPKELRKAVHARLSALEPYGVMVDALPFD
jgi:hypothetical protein